MFWWILFVVVISRSLAFLVFQTGVVSNDSGLAVIPLGEPAYLDYGIYKAHISSAWTEIWRPFAFLEQLVLNGSLSLDWLQSQALKPGPLLPSLLNWSGYDLNRKPLSWIFLFGGAALGAGWAVWVGHRGAPRSLQLLLAGFPALVYYSFLVSTDLLYAVIIAVWFVTACGALEREQSKCWWLCSGLTLLALIARPNALILTPLMVLVAWKSNDVKAKIVWSIFWIAVGLYGVLYYIPYYLVHDFNASNTHYWGLYPADYYNGSWLGLQPWIGRPISWLIFSISKVLYAIGLRPSYSNLPNLLVALRALPGLLFLPGLVYGLVRGRSFDRIFVVMFMAPVFVGAAQERYILAITPILALWGFQGILWFRDFNSKSPK
jgi:uncharacterized membrane protein